MTDRIPLAQHTKASLDQLYEDLGRAEAELRRYAEADSADAAAGSYALRAERVEARLARVTGLYEQWVKAGPPPLGASMARWWDARLAELHAAIHAPTAASCSPAAPETEPNNAAATQATERPTLRERHRAQWLALTDAEQTARIAALDEDDEPEQPARTTPDNSPTSSDWTPPPPGDRREQLPDAILALLDIPTYTSTACETAELLAAAVARHPAHTDELQYWEQRQRQRCRINNKYTGVNCQHTETEDAVPPAAT